MTPHRTHGSEGAAREGGPGGNAGPGDGTPDDPASAGAGVFVPDLLAGQVALVTGGGSGIGYGIARTLIRHGAAVVIASRDREKLEAAAGRLREEGGGRALAVPADVREPDSIRAAVERTVAELGGLDLLVNNAAGNFYCASEELSPGGWHAVVETDLYGTFYGCQAAHPVMRDRGGGRIVSISMTLHHRGWPRMAHACAAKAGVDALTRTLALEWARDGIRVNAVAPGPIPTEGVRRAFASDGDGDGGDEPDGVTASGREDADGAPDIFGERRAAAYARRFIPAGRLGTPEDIGRVVAFLASPAGDWITGQVLVVDGGESLASPRVLPGADAAPELSGR